MIDRRLAATLVGGATLVAVVGGAAAAHAAPSVYPPVPASCTVASTAPADGSTDSVSCAGATTGDSYEVQGHSTVVVLATTTATSPSFTVSFTVHGLPSGAHEIVVVDTTTGATLASDPITVSPAVTTGSTGSSSGSLPFTGADVAAMSVAGVALIAGGGAAFVAGARRRRRTDA